MIEHWYITVAAVKQWQQICGIPQADDGPLFDRAAKELDAVCQEARLVRAAGESSRDAALYRATAVIRGRRYLLDLYVAEGPRPEGDAPQLVRVRVKRGPRSGGSR